MLANNNDQGPARSHWANGIHRAISHILKLNGAGEYMEQIPRDLEKVGSR